MRKLFKHLKPYAATIAAIVVILIVQAYCAEVILSQEWMTNIPLYNIDRLL